MITHIHIFRLARATSSSRSVWRVWCLPTLSSPVTNQSCSLASSTGLCYIKFQAYSWDLWFVDYGFVYFRMVKPRIVLLIFVSGKVVLTGAKVRQEIYEAFDNIYPILKNFKKQWPGSGNPNKYKEQMKIASLYILTMCKYYYVNCCPTVFL